MKSKTIIYLLLLYSMNITAQQLPVIELWSGKVPGSIKEKAADKKSARPDFAMLMYPAYLDEGTNRTLTPEFSISSETPPVFLFATADDGYCNSSLVMTQALRNQKVPVELHVMPTGGMDMVCVQEPVCNELP